MWELTGPSSGPFPNACSLCAMELNHARPWVAFATCLRLRGVSSLAMLAAMRRASSEGD